jgi:hypothetical protein
MGLVQTQAMSADSRRTVIRFPVFPKRVKAFGTGLARPSDRLKMNWLRAEPHELSMIAKVHAPLTLPSPRAGESEAGVQRGERD